jgi:hypothetical protein
LNYFSLLIHVEKTSWFIPFNLRNFSVNICGKERSKKNIVGALNASESAIADDTMMTPSETGGSKEVFVFRAPEAAIQIF